MKAGDRKKLSGNHFILFLSKNPRIDEKNFEKYFAEEGFDKIHS
jgi:hypothetical protein